MWSVYRRLGHHPVSASRHTDPSILLGRHRDHLGERIERRRLPTTRARRPQEARGRSRRRGGLVVALLLTLSGCGADASIAPTNSLVAAVANFDLSPDRAERFMVGLYTSDRGEVALGSIELSFSYLGRLDPSRPGPSEPATAPPASVATFLPIPASEPPPDGESPTISPPPGVRGVYSTEPIRFETPGFWEVRVKAKVDGTDLVAEAAFEVFETSLVPGPGDDAPRTVQPLLGDPDVEPKSIDSRLAIDPEPADPILHRRTIADALDAGKPTMVVVSTPVFCVSRFCGPITEAVRLLALRYEDEVEFVHLEVWADFETDELNPWAVEWIAPKGRSEAAEPWVFLIDADGTITNRWDNVASTGELETAIELILGP